MTFKIAAYIIQSFLLRNRIMMTVKSRKAKKHAVNLHWWELDGENQNVGDTLSPVVVNYLMERNGIRHDRSCDNKTRHLYAIGSIVDTSYQNATVWGSGVLNGQRSLWWRKLRWLDVRCVRGPETRKVLMANGYECPECYGDPAVLLPLIYNPTLDPSHEKTYEYRVIQHFSYGNTVPNALSPMTPDYKSFIDEVQADRQFLPSRNHPGRSIWNPGSITQTRSEYV